MMQLITNLHHPLWKTSYAERIDDSYYHYRLNLGEWVYLFFSDIAFIEFQTLFQLLTTNKRACFINNTTRKDLRNSRDRQEYIQQKLVDIKSRLTSQQCRLNDINTEQGALKWLPTLPTMQEEYMFNKREFWDLVNIRYGWPLSRTPRTCRCGNNFNIANPLTCKKDGFITLRHNRLRNITASLLKEVCHDVQIDPTLQKLTGEQLEQRAANTSDEARFDVAAREFWAAGQIAFF